MTARILEGKVFAAQIRAEAKKKAGQIKADYGVTPGLAVIIVGENPASRVYVRNKHKACEELGIYSEVIEMPDSTTKEELLAKGVQFSETDDLENSISQLDVLYMSRVQRERFISEEEYLRLKDFFVLTADKMALAKPDMIVLHPLPRVNEIATEVDEDPRAAYFAQVRFGMYVRMALIMKLLGAAEPLA